MAVDRVQATAEAKTSGLTSEEASRQWRETLRAASAQARSFARSEAKSRVVIAQGRASARGAGAALGDDIENRARALTQARPIPSLVRRDIAAAVPDRPRFAEAIRTPEAIGTIVVPQEQEVEPEFVLYNFRVYPSAARMRGAGERTYQAYILNRPTFDGVPLQSGKRYTLEFSSNGCKTETLTLTPDGPQERGPRRIALEWKDSKVTIVSDRDALVFVGNSRKVAGRARPGRPFIHEVTFGKAQEGAPPSRSLNYRIQPTGNAEEGLNPYLETIELGPDQSAIIRARFRDS